MGAGTSLAAFLAPSEARASSSISAIPRVAGIRAAIPPLAPLPCGGLGVDKSGLAGCEPEDSPEGAERIARLLFQLRPCGGAGEGPWRTGSRSNRIVNTRQGLFETTGIEEQLDKCDLQINVVPCRWVLKKFLHRGFSFVRARQFLQADRAIDPRFRCPGSLRNKLQGFFQVFERSTVIRVLILE